jgi:uncharacterized protein
VRIGALLVLLLAWQCAVAQEGVLAWQVLAEVKQVRARNGTVEATFPPSILKLHGTSVRLQGFVLPLEVGEKHGRFLLSEYPSDCGFCMPGGPEQIVEVRAKAPLKYTNDIVVLKGRLEVLQQDPTGLFYRLSDAVQMPAK